MPPLDENHLPDESSLGHGGSLWVGVSQEFAAPHLIHQATVARVETEFQSAAAPAATRIFSDPSSGRLERWGIVGGWADSGIPAFCFHLCFSGANKLFGGQSSSAF